MIDVFCDLQTQRLDGGKFGFRTNTLEETEFQFGFGMQVDGMEVEQMALDGERICPERWSLADVGDSVEDLIGNTQAGNVHTVSRHKLVIVRQVNCRHSVLVSITAAMAGTGNNAERPSQEHARLADLALTDEPANFAAGNVMAAKDLLGIDLDFESHLCAEAGQRVNVAFCLVTEMKVVSLVDLAGVQ